MKLSQSLLDSPILIGWRSLRDTYTRWFCGSSRGVSEVVGTMMNLAILAIVVSSVSMVGVDYISSMKEMDVEQRLDGLGQRLVFSLQDADQTTRSASTDLYTDYQLTISLPDRVANQQYQVSIDSAGDTPTHTWNEDHTGLTTSEWGRYGVTLTANDGVIHTVYFTSLSQFKPGVTVDGGQITLLRPAATTENIESDLCAPYDTNGVPGIQTVEAASASNDLEPDTCAIVLQEGANP